MRRRIARTLDWLIAGLIEGPMIDQEALDALINAAADVEEKADASDRATNVTAESPHVTK
jgi:hypothetical protein